MKTTIFIVFYAASSLDNPGSSIGCQCAIDVAFSLCICTCSLNVAESLGLTYMEVIYLPLDPPPTLYTLKIL